MLSDPVDATPRRGRPRDEGAKTAILAAAATLVRTRGYEGVTMEAIAAEARVGKQTIYRWWPTKARVVGDAFLEGYVEFPESELAYTADLWIDLENWMRADENGFQGGFGNLVRIAASVAAADRVLAVKMAVKFSEPSRAMLLARLDAAVSAGQLDADLDLGAVADLLQAVVSHAGLTHADNSAITNALGIIRAAGQRSAPGSNRRGGSLQLMDSGHVPT